MARWRRSGHPTGSISKSRYPRLTRPGCRRLAGRRRGGLRAWRDAGPTPRRGLPGHLGRACTRGFSSWPTRSSTPRGQAFVMAFQAGGTHALDRALEAIAYAVEAMASIRRRRPGQARPGRTRRGGQDLHRCASRARAGDRLQHLPDLELLSGSVRSLVTGNPVIIKPHPHAVLPLAITVQVPQQVLAEHGFDPHLVTLAAEQTAMTWPNARHPARGQDRRLHRDRVRSLAGGARDPGARVHREVRRQRDRAGLHR